MIFLERLIFYLLVFTVPFQARLVLHRWVQPFNQWTSAYLYGTDILIFLLFVFWAVRAARAGRRNEIKSAIAETFKIKWSNPHIWLAGFFIVSALSIFNSRIVGLSLYQLLKLAEFVGFYFYLRSAFGKIYEFRRILTVIVASGVFQAIIAIAQYLKQGSLGLKLLGESPLSVNATGVAVFIADSQKYLRAYGTAPHPNVLAAWLMLAIFAFYFLLFYHLKSKGPQPIVALSHGRGLVQLKNSWWAAIYVVLLFGFFFTFSRAIIGLWALGVIIGISFLLFERNSGSFFPKSIKAVKSHVAAIAVVTFITAGLFSAVYWPQVWSRVHISAGEEAVTQRIFYNKMAESVTMANPILGVGIGQFVPQLMNKLKHWPAYFYQPVHNVYLLIASETGLVGLSLFLLFLFLIFYGFIKRAKMQKAYQYSFSILAFSFLAMGLFDHFLWTLQQGSLIFWMIWALISLDPDSEHDLLNSS